MRTVADNLRTGVEASRASQLEELRLSAVQHVHHAFVEYVSVQVRTNTRPSIEVQDFLDWAREILVKDAS